MAVVVGASLRAIRRRATAGLLLPVELLGRALCGGLGPEAGGLFVADDGCSFIRLAVDLLRSHPPRACELCRRGWLAGCPCGSRSSLRRSGSFHGCFQLAQWAELDRRRGCIPLYARRLGDADTRGVRPPSVQSAPRPSSAWLLLVVRRWEIPKQRAPHSSWFDDTVCPGLGKIQIVRFSGAISCWNRHNCKSPQSGALKLCGTWAEGDDSNSTELQLATPGPFRALALALARGAGAQTSARGRTERKLHPRASEVV
eukprot:COSAG06_NODE_4948_length_3839_cov_3.741979_7_plen_256_part_01